MYNISETSVATANNTLFHYSTTTQEGSQDYVRFLMCNRSLKMSECITGSMIHCKYHTIKTQRLNNTHNAKL